MEYRQVYHIQPYELVPDRRQSELVCQILKAIHVSRMGNAVVFLPVGGNDRQ